MTSLEQSQLADNSSDVLMELTKRLLESLDDYPADTSSDDAQQTPYSHDFPLYDVTNDAFLNVTRLLPDSIFSGMNYEDFSGAFGHHPDSLDSAFMPVSSLPPDMERTAPPAKPVFNEMALIKTVIVKMQLQV